VTIAMTIFEPEFAFLPFACDVCGGRFLSEADVAMHKRETCEGRYGAPVKKPERLVPFELPDGRGIADGGRRT
jgi:hypothetical protein